MWVMQKPSRQARILVLAGVAAGSLSLLAASPAGAIGVRLVDLTSAPASIAAPLRPAPVPAPVPPAVPAPVPPPAPPAPSPAPQP